jgi:signal transduction histidine kinase
MSLTSTLFLAMRDEVLASWETEVRARVRSARGLLRPVLINTLPLFYGNIAEALTPSFQGDSATSHTNVAGGHGEDRARMTNFGPDQVAEEFQLFRAAIGTVAPGRVELGPLDWSVIDSSINLATVEAIRSYMAAHETMRRRVAAALSHDMRTPLSLVVGGASLIERASDLEAARRGAARVKSNAWRLSHMLGELLIALTDRPAAEIAMNVSRIDLQELIAAVVEDLGPDAVGRVSWGGERVVGFWSENHMRRALGNLVGNARKHGDGGMVTIRTDAMHGRLALAVHNSGARIPKELQAEIFEYLHQGPCSAMGAGFGIGLHYVKSVAQAHGGSVTVDSSDELGTTFILDIPLDCRPFVATRGE